MENTRTASVMQTSNGHADARLAVLTPEDRHATWELATVMLDVTLAFGRALAQFLVREKMRGLPDDSDMIDSLAAHADADAQEILVTLRAGMNPDSHVAPVEALAHARYLRSRGVGLSTLVQIYQYGFAMFRDLLIIELQSRVSDRGQLERVGAAADAYSFPFITTTLQRLAYEYGSDQRAWSPTPHDPVLEDPDSFAAAKRLRDSAIQSGTWVAAHAEQADARATARRRLDDFVETLVSGVADRGLHDRLALAATSITIQLADEPDSAVTLLLDRSPIEVVDGRADAESLISMPSVDLPRMWSPDFYLPISIAKGRATLTGPGRKFLRILPILRTAGEAPTADSIPDIVQ